MNSSGEKEALFSGPLNAWPVYKTHWSFRRASWRAGDFFVHTAASCPVDSELVPEGFLVVYLSSVLSLTTWALFQEIKRFQQIQEKGEEMQS